MSRRKNDFNVSLAYKFAFFTPRLLYGFGDASIGITAGNGSDGAGETERRIDIDDPNDDLLLWLITLGGFIGRATEVGVPGQEGTGDPMAFDDSVDSCARIPFSGGTGLSADILRAGRSIFKLWAILLGSSRLSRAYWPSFVFIV